MVQHVPKVVHLLIIPRTDEAPLPDGEGQAVVLVLLPDGGVKGLLQALQPLQPPEDGGQGAARHRPSLLHELGQHRQAVRQ